VEIQARSQDCKFEGSFSVLGETYFVCVSWCTIQIGLINKIFIDEGCLQLYQIPYLTVLLLQLQQRCLCHRQSGRTTYKPDLKDADLSKFEILKTVPFF